MPHYRMDDELYEEMLPELGEKELENAINDVRLAEAAGAEPYPKWGEEHGPEAAGRDERGK